MYIPLWFLVASILVVMSLMGAKISQLLFFGAIFALATDAPFTAVILFLISFGIWHLEVPSEERSYENS